MFLTLECLRSETVLKPTTLQYAANRIAKGRLLACNRRPFGVKNVAFCERVCNVLTIRWLRMGRIGAVAASETYADACQYTYILYSFMPPAPPFTVQGRYSSALISCSVPMSITSRWGAALPGAVLQ